MLAPLLLVPAVHRVLVQGGFAKIYEPKVGSAERKAIMDGLRKAVTPSLKQPVVFKTDWIRSTGSWAFLKGVPQRPDGGKLDYTKTTYQDAIDNGAFDNNFTGLLQKTSSKPSGGTWKAVEWTIGATDVPWDGMWNRRKLPRELFPH